MKKRATKVEKTTSPSSEFIVQAFDMSWRLALVVLVPIVGGYYLDEWLDILPVLTIAGFFLAMLGTGYIMWRTLQMANKENQV